MLPTFSKPFGALADGVPVAVAEVDDQEVRVSLVTFPRRPVSLHQPGQLPVPGRDHPAPLADLIYAVAELIQPLLDQAQALALCLPLPVDFDGKGDGIIRRFPGTMTVTEFSQQPVLAALQAELQDRGCPPLPMTLVSEPDAVLLAAGVQQPGCSRYVGLTWGSSVDVGFAAPGSIVLRWRGIPGDLMLFDSGLSPGPMRPLRPGGFLQGPGQLCPWQRSLSKDGLHRLPGGGLPAGDDQGRRGQTPLLPGAPGCALLRWLDFDTLAEFLTDPEKGGTLAHFCREPEDREVGLAVGQAVLDRAAKLLCVGLASVLQFVGAGRDPKAPACVGLHGAAFSFPR